MVRSSASLFLPGAESLLLSVLVYPFITSFMQQSMASDFSPLLRSILWSQLVLVVAAMLSHMLVAAVDRSR